MARAVTEWSGIRSLESSNRLRDLDSYTITHTPPATCHSRPKKVTSAEWRVASEQSCMSLRM